MQFLPLHHVYLKLWLDALIIGFFFNTPFLSWLLIQSINRRANCYKSLLSSILIKSFTTLSIVAPVCLISVLPLWLLSWFVQFIQFEDIFSMGYVFIFVCSWPMVLCHTSTIISSKLGGCASIVNLYYKRSCDFHKHFCQNLYR